MPAPTLLDRMPRTRLVLLAFLMLFVELTLIRWLGANVLYLAYFSNIVLLGSFLGIGLGFLRAFLEDAELDAFALSSAVATSIVAVVTLASVVGSVLPMALKRLGFDPAVSSTPFIASVVDVMGLMVYFGVATLILHLAY